LRSSTRRGIIDNRALGDDKFPRLVQPWTAEVPSASIGTKMALPTCNDSPTESRKPMPPGSACRRHAFRCSSEQKSAFVVQPEVAQQLSAYRMPDHTTAVSGVTERSAWPRSQVSTQMCAPQLRQSDPMSVSHPSMAPTPSASMAHRAFTATDLPRRTRWPVSGFRQKSLKSTTAGSRPTAHEEKHGRTYAGRERDGLPSSAG
jgi:hypothetical protein